MKLQFGANKTHYPHIVLYCQGQCGYIVLTAPMVYLASWGAVWVHCAGVIPHIVLTLPGAVEYNVRGYPVTMWGREGHGQWIMMATHFWLPCSPLSPDVQGGGGSGSAKFFFSFSA